MAGVEHARPHMNNQVRLVARSVEDLSKLGDIMPVGFGDNSMLDDELAEEGEGTIMDHDGSTQREKRIRILLEGKPLWGGTCQKIEIEEVGVRPTGGRDPEDPEAWEKEIGKAGKGGAYVFSHGSLLEGGNGERGAFVRPRFRPNKGSPITSP